jgi:hypothetical protein
VARRSRVDLTACNLRMEELRKKMKREVQARDVLRDAETNKQSPFKGWFTWEVEKGYRKNLLNEARQLIANLKVLYHDPDTGEPVAVRRYMRLIVERPDHTMIGAYVPRQKAMTNSGLHAQVVELAQQHLQTYITRFRTFNRIEPTFPLIQRAMTMLEAASKVRAKGKAQ